MSALRREAQRPRHAFADESARGSRYYVCASVVHQGDIEEMRRVARKLCVAGQRRWHFAKESDRRRKTILSEIVQVPGLGAWVGVGKGDEVEIRARLMSELGPALVDVGVTRLVIESRQGRDEHDRRALRGALGPNPRLYYEHLQPAQDPGLWLADAFAWAFGAGGAWRSRLEPILMPLVNVGSV